MLRSLISGKHLKSISVIPELHPGQSVIQRPVPASS